jgi:hypothetical protein
MYILDLLARCGLCGHVQLQRFYLALPLHPMTLERLVARADRAAHAVDADCENCGTEMRPPNVERSALHFGFADDAGVLRLYTRHSAPATSPNDDGDGDQGDSDQGDEDNAALAGALRASLGEDAPAPGDTPPEARDEAAPRAQRLERSFQLRPGVRLDPQVQPEFAPDPDEGTVVDSLDESAIVEHFGRAFNPKRACRRLAARFERRDDELVAGRLAPGMWALFAPDLQTLEAGLDDLEGYPTHAPLERVSLDDAAPHGLATHRRPVSMPGRLSSWMPPGVLDDIEQGRCRAEIHLSGERAQRALERIFEVARLRYRVEDTESEADLASDDTSGEDTASGAAGPTYVDVTTPRGDRYRAQITMRSILRRAAYTGLTPGEAARLTGEEIAGILLGVWGES